MPDNETVTSQRKETTGQKKKSSDSSQVKVPEDIEVQCCGKWRQD